jgi:hypothetical protein
LRPNFYRFLKENRAAGEPWLFSAAPQIPTNRSRDILPTGDPAVPVGFNSS